MKKDSRPIPDKQEHGWNDSMNWNDSMKIKSQMACSLVRAIGHKRPPNDMCTNLFLTGSGIFSHMCRNDIYVAVNF